jgi:EAL domain-containing protein (putative c-di-GMP-specific phosphodiesterase class I)
MASTTPSRDDAVKPLIERETAAIVESLEPVLASRHLMSQRALITGLRVGGWMLILASLLLMWAQSRGVVMPASQDTSGLAPMLGVLGLLIAQYFQASATQRRRVSELQVDLLTSVFGLMCVVILWVNQPWPAFFSAAMIVVINTLGSPRLALLWSLLVTAEVAYVMFLPDGRPVWSAEGLRLGAACVVTLLFMQMIARHSLRLTASADQTLEQLRSLTGQLSNQVEVAREARDRAERVDEHTGFLKTGALLDEIQVGLEREPDQTACLMVVRISGVDRELSQLDPERQAIALDVIAQRLTGLPRLPLISRTERWTFALWLPHAVMQDLSTYIETLGESLSRILPLPDQRFPVRAATGWALYPSDARDASELLHRAEQAAGFALELPQTRALRFDPSMASKAEERQTLAVDLQRALESGQFHLDYQPIVDAATGRFHKAEALIRWQHPTRGPVRPSDFTWAIEGAGLGVAITNWVIEEAARQVARWRVAIDPRFQLSVNCPPEYLHACVEHPESSLQWLMGLELPPSGIVLEVTEGAFLDINPEVLKVISLLRLKGFQFAIDDFGMGYSSFSQLDRLPVDYMKIDREFIRFVDTSHRRRSICEALIDLGHQLGIEVVAEGVETPQQRDILAQANCDYLQGYLLSRPISALDLERLSSATPAQTAATPPSPTP